MERSQDESSPESPAGQATQLALQLLGEMRKQREAVTQQLQLASKERRSERRWKLAFQTLVFGVPVLLGVFYFLFFLNSAGFRWGPFGSVVGIVRIEGTISAGERASADTVIPLLQKAFANPSVKAVALKIDSGGGAPVEAERIYTELASLRQLHPKPVVAVIDNIGASAAYMIALHADKIIAGKYSLVGSIGAIISSWQLDRALARWDASQRVFASGPMKEFLNPFTSPRAATEEKAQALVEHLGGEFASEVQQRRGDRLRAGAAIATGEVWPGSQALQLGLADEIGTVDSYVASVGLQAFDYGPHQSQGLSVVGGSIEKALAGALQRLASSSIEVR